MGPDHDTAKDDCHASRSISLRATIMDESSLPRSDTAPTADETGQRGVDHDSLVTVRLSEPPYLQVNTNLPQRVPHPRTSLGGNEDTLPAALAISTIDGQDGGAGLEGSEEWENTQSPAALIPDHSKSLMDELGADGSPNDTDSIGSRSDDADNTHPEADDTSVTSHPRGSQEMNWDQLQQIEDQESKDQVSEHVSLLLDRYRGRLSCRTCLATSD
jgi:hypothetical protein